MNFFSHVGEGGGGAEAQAKAVAARRANRGVPYMFLKPTEGVIIGNGDEIVLPSAATASTGKSSSRPSSAARRSTSRRRKAADHIFGYMVMLDISDRGGRPPGGFSSGSDWFVGKGHDTFGPMGPWIVPKEFYGDPMKNLRQTLSVGTTQMQEGTAGDMIHSLYEVIEYASSIVTLFPGDVIGAGTSGGVGMGTTVRGKQVFLKAGRQDRRDHRRHRHAHDAGGAERGADARHGFVPAGGQQLSQAVARTRSGAPCVDLLTHAGRPGSDCHRGPRRRSWRAPLCVRPPPAAAPRLALSAGAAARERH